jgi:exopolysaccharide biosynthesis protein
MGLLTQLSLGIRSGNMQAVIMVVDSSDRKRVGLTKAELHKMMEHEVCMPHNIQVCNI